ncbi:H(+)-transporting V0 sector ATPase subunit d, partial [Elasticomyces elasticus]
MEGLFFNVNGGYVEGIVRGYRNSLLSGQNYSNLTQCETIDDVKLQLAPSYGDFLASLPPNPSTSDLAGRMTDKLVSEFKYLTGQATGSSAKFLEYMKYGYMIDNVALLITGSLHGRELEPLLKRCHPLGWFETLPLLSSAGSMEDLYNMDFHDFISTHADFQGSPTQDIMAEILQFEADRRSINITLNSFGTDLSKSERAKLYPQIGKLYPEGNYMLGKAEDVEGVALAVSAVADYKAFFDAVGLSQGGGLGGMGGGPTDGK